MRLQMAGVATLNPVILTLTNGSTFTKVTYTALGYTNFDLIVIGAAGGRGGGTDNGGSEGGGPPAFRPYGGGGGGGGTARVSGALSSLSTSCAVVVGVKGSDGVEGTSFNDLPFAVTDEGAGSAPRWGNAGGLSSFDGAFCRAYGGDGGYCAWYDSPGLGGTGKIWGGKGGGGAGGGGGAVGLGGTGGNSTSSAIGTNATNGADGSWTGTVGVGGGGAGGGVGHWDGFTVATAGAGGRGAYNSGNLEVFGPGGPALEDPSFGDVIPGSGGGAKATPVNASNSLYGSNAPGASPNGLVTIRLTQL